MSIFKPIKTVLLFCCFISFLGNPRAQYAYFGHTNDLVTETPLENVTIFHKKRGIINHSDQNGAFVFEFDNTTVRRKYQIVHNLFFAPVNEDVSISIYNSNGVSLLKSIKVSKGASCQLPQLKQGIYILQVRSNTSLEALKLFSNGTKITFLQNLSIQKNSNESDTLVFSKAGYYSVEIAFPQKDTVAVIKLLSKNETDMDFLPGLPDYNAFELLQSSPFVTNQSEVESVKFIYDKNDNTMYFMNSKIHQLHFYFAEQFLGYEKGHYHFNNTQYTNSGERYLYPGSLNYYRAQNKYVLRFYAGDQMLCEDIEQIINKIYASTYISHNLFLYPNNSNWDNCTNVPIITSEDLYQGQNYQALNLAKGYGFLRRVNIENLNDTYLGRHDIVLLNGIPNDVSVVSGIITTEFQTPLSHINVLSHNRGTPNMALRDGWDNPTLASLEGELVSLEVLSDSFILRKAGLEEANAFWEQNEPQTTIFLDKDVQTASIVELDQMGYSNVNIIGGKAANFAELLKLSSPQIQTPENPFAIPFYYYCKHISNHNIDAFIIDILSDENFKVNQKYRSEKLKEIRDKIIDSPVDKSLVNLVRSRINDFNDFSSYRFRSSTNAEDLEFFSGAGLYDSKSAKKNHESKTIENAIKKVWASLWNYRAFEEREYFKINHLSSAMAILVHRSFPNEDANGVVITRNLYNINPGFVVNAQFKEYSIVFPEVGVLHDQIVLYNYSLDESSNFTIEYLSHSNLSGFEGQNVLSNNELQQLGEYCLHIKKYFYNNVPNSCNCDFNEFGLDIEFKIDSPEGKRKLYIKQVRRYK